MKQALSHLLNDLLSAILFLAVYLVTANITAAAAVAITVGLAQITVQRLTGRRIWPMQWIGLAVVVVLSAASIATQSPRFVMLKPSLGHFAIAAAMLKRGWMSRYLPEVAQRYLPANAPVIAGYAWAGLMAALGLANILIALYAPFAIWVWFISVGAIGAKVAAFRAAIRRLPGDHSSAEEGPKRRDRNHGGPFIGATQGLASSLWVTVAPAESGGPGATAAASPPWIPAFAGMTTRNRLFLHPQTVRTELDPVDYRLEQISSSGIGQQALPQALCFSQ